jgi:glycosyltransferase involved in cell wall biosynthesis
MLILLDCRPLWVSPFNAEKSHFIIDCASLLSERHGVDWLLLTDKRVAPGLPSMLPDGLDDPDAKGPNAKGLSVKGILVRKALPGRIGRKLWYNWQLPSAVRRNKPDLLMTTEGISVPRASCPQCTWISAATALSDLRHARALFTISEKDKASWTSKDPDLQEKLFVIRPSPDAAFIPLSPMDKEKEKLDRTEGMEYFLVIISRAEPAELINLLKAFSLFKKRQRSNLRLVLTGTDATSRLSATGRIDSYLYRSSVHAIDDPSGRLLPRLMAAAYAYISPFDRDAPGVDLLNAWAAGTPVIASIHGPSQELGPDAVLTMDPQEPASLAARLMRVFTNEEERSALVEKGALRLRSFDRDRTAGCLWEGILRAKG